MKNIIIGILFFSSIAGKTYGQDFLSKGEIEFEVKTNIKKKIGNAPWAEQFKDMLPQFKTAYFKFTFGGNKSIYQFDRWAEGPKAPEWMRKDDEQDIYYFDHSTDKISQQKIMFGSEFMMQDSIPKISWRLTNESRQIAGFNCRKAIGVIMDSVYVFAFYTEEIMISGGPCTINGLPGMVLGLTVPRLYTSFIATKVKVGGVDEAVIKPIIAKKFSTRTDMIKLIIDRLKQEGNNEDEDSKNWVNQFIWSSQL